jgi:hypothetical protein
MAVLPCIESVRPSGDERELVRTTLTQEEPVEGDWTWDEHDMLCPETEDEWL